MSGITKAPITFNDIDPGDHLLVSFPYSIQPNRVCNVYVKSISGGIGLDTTIELEYSLDRPFVGKYCSGQIKILEIVHKNNWGFAIPDDKQILHPNPKDHPVFTKMRAKFRCHNGDTKTIDAVIGDWREGGAEQVDIVRVYHLDKTIGCNPQGEFDPKDVEIISILDPNTSIPITQVSHSDNTITPQEYIRFTQEFSKLQQQAEKLGFTLRLGEIPINRS